MSIQETVWSFIVESFYPPKDLDRGASLLDSGTIDSTGVLELITFVEERFGIVVGDRDIHPDNFDSLDRIVAFVERKLRETGEPRQTDATPVPSP